MSSPMVTMLGKYIFVVHVYLEYDIQTLEYNVRILNHLSLTMQSADTVLTIFSFLFCQFCKKQL